MQDIAKLIAVFKRFQKNYFRGGTWGQNLCSLEATG
jgi:hypothetical protein